jgi:hypothetical protein
MSRPPRGPLLPLEQLERELGRCEQHDDEEKEVLGPPTAGGRPQPPHSCPLWWQLQLLRTDSELPAKGRTARPSAVK